MQLKNEYRQNIFFFLPFLICLISISAKAQFTKVKGVIRDYQLEEPISYASIYWKKTGRGLETDSLGFFSINIDKYSNNDTLIISAVGYVIKQIPTDKILNPDLGDIFLKVAPPVVEVVVKKKYDRGVWFWKKIMAQKYKNDPKKIKNYYCQLYNKIEFDLINFNQNQLKKNVFTKPFGFVFNYIDSISERKPFIPIYLIETMSDFYYKSNPTKSYENIFHVREKGFENKSIIKEFGGTYQQINPYSETIDILRFQFVNILHPSASDFYKFKISDTMYWNGRALIRFTFTSKIIGSPTFDGEAWIDAKSLGIQKITLRPNVNSNINFIEGLSILQEYNLYQDSIWFLQKEKFVADIAPVGNGNLAFKSRKTTFYQTPKFNDTSITNVLADIKGDVSVVVSKDVNMNLLEDSVNDMKRPIPLEHSELLALKVIDTLFKNKTFNLYKNALEVVATGVYDIGNFTLGPWTNWVSGNQYEGFKLRFDLATSYDFSSKWNIGGYLAYGFLDEKFKGGVFGRYQISRQPWQYILLNFKSDVTSRSNNLGFGVSSLFGSLLRDNNIPLKLQYLEQTTFTYFKENHKGFSFKIDIENYNYDPLINLPSITLYSSFPNDPFRSFQTNITLRYAHNERFLQRNFSRFSIRSRTPIFSVSLVKSWDNFLLSTNKFEKIQASIEHLVSVPRLGSLNYKVVGTYIFGKVSYPFLDFVTGNEVYYYNPNAFNLLNQFEIASDKNLYFLFEHNILNSFFTYFKTTRKWKLRQFWTLKALVGNISTQNAVLNTNSQPFFNSLNGNVYAEIGTGFDNIFKYFRIDFIWRLLTPQTAIPLNDRTFAVFASFRFSF